MIFSSIFSVCVANKFEVKTNLSKSEAACAAFAQLSDVVVPLALFIIGLTGLFYGYLPPAAAYSILGAGGALFISGLFQIVIGCTNKCRHDAQTEVA